MTHRPAHDQRLPQYEEPSSSSTDLPPTNSADLDLFCPQCEYNLRGCPSDVCPECGNAFDRERLVIWATRRCVDLRFRPEPTAHDDELLLLETLFTPSRFGRGFPVFADEQAARRYGHKARLWASAALFLWSFVIPVFAPPISVPILVLFVLIPSVVVGSVVCEALTAALLAKLVQPFAVPASHRFAFWNSLCHCFAGHLAFLCTFSALFLVSNWLPFVLLAQLAWWCWCVGRAVIARGEPDAGRIAAVLLIPVAAAVAIAVGGFLALLLALTCSEVAFNGYD